MNTKFNLGVNTVMIKSITIGILTLIMLIPISMVQSIISERESNEKSVQDEIGSKWGGTQKIISAIMILPYTETLGNQSGVTKYAYFLPTDLRIDGDIKTEKRSRTLYEAIVYQANLKIKGNFDYPDYKQLGLKMENIKWDDACIAVGIPYMEGIINKITFNINGKPYPVQPGIMANTIINSGFTIKMPLKPEDATQSYTFDYNLLINGTNGLYFEPIGKETQVALTSDWNTVSFNGSFLPTERKITDNGFKAQWNIFDYNRNYSQMWKDDTNKLDKSSFGLEIKLPVDKYQKTMRSVKYAILFIALTFIIFFLIELLSGTRIHPIQYLLVSFALVLFYALLLALSEHLYFGLSYLISAIAIISLITTYTITLFKNKKQVLLMGAFLTALYAYLYTMLQLENMALLFGTTGLFVILAAVMYMSRKINWYRSKTED